MMTPDHTRQISEWIKARAAELGFSACDISRAGKLEKDEDSLRNWLLKGYHGEMQYMARNLEKRTDPRLLLEGAKSVISVLLNYFPQEHLPEENNYKIARYAYGKDYHEVIRGKLKELIEGLRLKVEDLDMERSAVSGQQSAVSDLTPSTPRPPFPPLLQESGPGGEANAGIRNPEFEARAFTDSAPVLDKAWAERAGLGWIGKNTCLIHPKLGSYFFVGEIITSLELAYDTDRINDLCGGCTKCIDACPTGAIIGPRVLDARKCISYLTIEYKGELPESEKEKFGNWIFGCDICQEVCPWNRKARPHGVEEFRPSGELESMNKEKWQDLSPEEFQRMFKGSAVKRTKYDGLMRNIHFLRD